MLAWHLANPNSLPQNIPSKVQNRILPVFANRVDTLYDLLYPFEKKIQIYCKGSVCLRSSIKYLFLSLAALALLLAGITGVLFYQAKDSIPVLNYHQINDKDKNALTVESDQFDAQIKYLSENGYHAITPQEMIDAWKNGTALPDKPVIITFDDGYADNYKNAYPILKKYQQKAVIFVVSDYVNVYPNYLTWDNIAEMQENDLIDFESHTLSHVNLLEDVASEEEARKQLTDSRKALEYHLKKPVRFIAYPCGAYDDSLIQLTEDCGYLGGFTVNYGLASKESNPYTLDRVPIFGGNTHTLLRFKLRLTLAPVLAPLDHIKTALKDAGYPRLSSFIPIP